MGYDAINLLGSSYGTRLALSYLRRHPEQVRSTVLVSAMPMDMHVPETTALDVEQSLEALFALCRADRDCSAAFPDLEDNLRTADRIIRQAPVPTRLEHPITGAVETVELTHDTFAASVRALLYEPWSQRLLPSYLQRAANGERRLHAVRRRVCRGQRQLRRGELRRRAVLHHHLLRGRRFR